MADGDHRQDSDELESEIAGALTLAAAAALFGWRVFSKAVRFLSNLIKKTFMFFGFKGSASVEGLKKAAEQLEREKKEKADKIIQDLINLAELIKRRALYYCPIDTGALRRSAKVKVSGQSATTATLSITFGDDTAYYALYVHEDLTKYHAPPTQAKFLERAIAESRADIINIFGSGYSSRIATDYGGGKTTVEGIVSS